MKVYTYYENIKPENKYNHQAQLNLIEKWKKSWTNKGFIPVVLTKENAKKSNYYNKLIDFVQEVHAESVGEELDDPGFYLSSFKRLVAHSTVSGLMVDYDLFNVNFLKSQINLSDNLYWLNGMCCCAFFSGKNSLHNLFEYWIKSKEKIVNFCKTQNCNYTESHGYRTKFGDQDFLMAVFKEGLKLNYFSDFRNFIPNFISNPPVLDFSDECGLATIDSIENFDILSDFIQETHSKLIHLSHKACGLKNSSAKSGSICPNDPTQAADRRIKYADIILSI